MSSIAFSEHALYQLRKRDITKKEVLMAISQPDKIVRQTKDRFQAIKKIGGRYLLVSIFDRTQSSLEVVTAFRTSKIKKYL